MNGINSFLDKFKKLVEYDDELKRIIIEIIKKNIGVEIKKKDLKIQNRVLYIKTTPYIKNEIFIKKDHILEKLNKSLENKTINDVK